MTEWIYLKEFKRLWHALIKKGWKARPPTGLNTEYTYVKPEVKGRLRKGDAGEQYFVGSQALWAFAKREGLIQKLLPAPPKRSVNLGRPPMGKQAAYAAAQKQMPTPSLSPGATETTAAAGTEQAGDVVDVPEGTEQAEDVTVGVPEDTEQAEGVTVGVPEDTEQAGDVGYCVAADTEQSGTMLVNAEIALDAFDSV